MSFSTSSRPSEVSDARQPGLGAFLRRKGIGVKERGDEGDVKLTEMTVQQQEEEARKENREVLSRGSLLSQMNALTSVIQPGIRGAVKDTWVQQPRLMPKGAATSTSGKSPSFKMERKLKEARKAPLPTRLSEGHRKIKKSGFRCGSSVTTAQGKQLKRVPSAGPVSEVKFWKDSPRSGPTGCWVEVTGFVREIAMPVAELSRLVDRFMSDGKVTLMHRNGDTIMLRDASPEDLAHFTRWLRECKASPATTLKRKLEDQVDGNDAAKRRASAEGHRLSKPQPQSGQLKPKEEVAIEPREFSSAGDGSRGLNGLPDEVLQIVLEHIPPEIKINSSPFGSLGLTCARLEHLVRTFNGRNQLRIISGGNKPITNEFVLTTFRRRRGVCRVLLADFTSLLPEMLIRMAQLPSSEYYKHITQLCLRGCGKLTGKAVNMFMKRCGVLSHIDLFDIPSVAADATFAGIRRNCRKLKTIRVGALRRRFTSSMTTESISNITMPLRDSPSCLEEVSLPRLDMGKIGQCGLDMIADRLHASLLRLDLSNPEGECPSPDNLSKLTRLKSLNLSGWSSSSEALVSALTSLGELEFLDLSDTSIGDAGLSLLAKSPPKLRRLKLSRCRSVSDDGVISILENCDNLEMLDLSFNRKISEAIFQRLRCVASKERFKRLGIKETNLVPLFTAQLADCLLNHTGNTAVIFTIELHAVEYSPPGRSTTCELSAALSLL
ncbi:hypothetical protein FOZ63_033830 [Perkinsus olseni]|uniref:F-box/LRR-repeat protein 15-like leucin rich repeat domain-containing protein n=1 Tax=Perkinsus olseni TaxID=32597 RepID=A0A7J6TPR7_PEROL|nr:hypothetical protein FOZ63_033830 [Perkinsus olseni]KAF4747045.1 hypothetical protein FOZ62_027881 [Perkinsus olseni]